MKNLKKLGELKLMPEKILNHEALVSFKGGSGGGGVCSIFVRSNGGEGPGYWSQRLYSVSEAQNHYNTGSTWAGDYKTTGYCCASCPF